MAEIQENSHKKIGAILLALFGVLAITFGVLQIRNTMYGPFALKNTLPSELKQQIVDNNTAYQQQLDTDKDTLSDFDELGVYGTSPYLFDTFGYGMSDAEVVRRGLALCPGAGRNCSGENVSVVTGNASSSLISSFNPNPGNIAEMPDFQSILSDPQQLRKILSQSIDDKTLRTISDDDLVKTARVLFASTTASSSLNQAR